MTNRHLLTDAEVRRMKGLKAPAYTIHKFLTMEDVLARGDVVSGREESIEPTRKACIAFRKALDHSTPQEGS